MLDSTMSGDSRAPLEEAAAVVEGAIIVQL
jgi:hypothetical protein